MEKPEKKRTLFHVSGEDQKCLCRTAAYWLPGVHWRSTHLPVSTAQSLSHSHDQASIPTHCPDSSCLFPVERRYPCSGSSEGMGAFGVWEGITPSYLASIIALILVPSTQHVFGKFWKHLWTFLPVHDDHWHFHQISCHRVFVSWPQRKHIREFIGQHPSADNAMTVPRPPEHPCTPPATPPPSFTSYSPSLSISFQESHAVYSFHHPRLFWTILHSKSYSCFQEDYQFDSNQPYRLDFLELAIDHFSA